MRLLDLPDRLRAAFGARLLPDAAGSYEIVWWLSILFGLLSAVINLPIVEKPVPRLAAASA